MSAAALVINAQECCAPDMQEQTWDAGANPELCLYRQRTLWLLRRYMRLSVEVGRLPSLLGREIFRSKAVSYHSTAFEDVVIFVHDIESSLAKLDSFFQELIARVVLQEYTQDEAAELLHCHRANCTQILARSTRPAK